VSAAMPHAGKTYVGVQLMRLLLHNTRNKHTLAARRGAPGIPNDEAGDLLNTRKPEVGPILCVCFTNHALDSFLEGMLDAGVPVTSMVRCGARSKSERLEACNVRNHTAR
jgi:hypothetical protein